MCGFAGLIHPRPGAGAGALRAEITSLTRVLAHRGPDDEGVFVDPDGGIALGHRRLSIHDLTAAGRQPMSSPCGRWTLAFNGEVYNFKALRGRLEQEGWVFRSHTDTEVLLAGICRWGVSRTLERCNGMLAMAAWDRSERRLVLARDRLGKKPLYYGWAGDVFVFGSELRVLEAHAGFRRELDPASVGLYLRLGYVPAPRSIYRRSWKLEPATSLTLDVDGPAPFGSASADLGDRVEPYWTAPDITAAPTADPRQVERRAVALLEEAVATRLEADVPVAVLLSGGTDSTAVAALARECSAGRLTTISLGFDEVGFDESVFAERVARRLGTDHLSLTATHDQAVAVVPQLATVYDEPFADSSQIAMMLISALARQHVTVVLTGDGGDEVFGGYNRHLWLPGIWDVVEGSPRWARGALARGLSASAAVSWSRVPRVLGRMVPASVRFPHVGDKLEKLSRLLAAGSRDQAYDSLTAIWPDPPLVAGRAHPAADTRRPAPSSPSGFSEWMMRRDLTGYLTDDLMVKVDRATMAHGLEARSPLLDHRLIEHVWSHGDVFRPRPRVGKRFLLEIAGRHVPRAWLDRAKMGFGVPIGQWLRGPLRAWAEDLLEGATGGDADWLDPAAVRRLWQGLVTGDRPHPHRVWSILMLQQWCRKHAAVWPVEPDGPVGDRGRA